MATLTLFLLSFIVPMLAVLGLFVALWGLP
jgi:hypothetical protein